MKIYYVKKDEFMNKVSLEELKTFSDGRVLNNQTKYTEHLIGLYLIKYLAKKYYDLDDYKIIYDGKKPKFKDEKLNFSVSHSENIVAVGFSDYNIGIDVEYMKNRDFTKLSKRYNINPSALDFYTFWTKYEAGIKLGDNPKFVKSQIIENNYMLSYASDKNLEAEIIKIS